MHIVIIGNGIAGITCARHVRKRSDHQITVISAETKHFFSRTALMYIYMGHMRFEDTKPYEDYFWQKNRINLRQAYVETIDVESKKLNLSGGETVPYDKLVIATGSKPNKFGWKGQDLEGVQGLYSYQDLELMEQNTKGIKRAVVVGGGLIGIEVAEMLQSRGIDVTFLVRENSFWNNVLPAEESAIINKHIKEHHIDLQLGTELEEIVELNGRANGVVTSAGNKIDCQAVFLAAGVSPNIEIVADTTIEHKRGILVNHYLETNEPDVYAIGDCAEFKEPLPDRRPIEQVWYTGKMQGKTLAKNICGEKIKYQPGHWFNSAKFLDIEYQTYGMVWAQLKDNEADFYWQAKDGKKCMHFVWDKTTKVFKGMNTFGIRLRHHLFDAWLTKEATINEVLSGLKAANFDPELYDKHEQEIIEKFTQENPNLKVELKKRSAFKKLIFG